MKKRILSMLLVIVMVLSLVPVSALADGAISVAGLPQTAAVGGEVIFSATVDGNPITDATWESSDLNIAKPIRIEGTNQCRIEGVGQGAAKITVKKEGLTDGVRWASFYIKQDSVAIEGPTTVTAGENVKLSFAVPEGVTQKNVKWTLDESCTTYASMDSETANPMTLSVNANAVGKKVKVNLSFNGAENTKELEIVAPTPGKITVTSENNVTSIMTGRELKLFANIEGSSLVNFTWELAPGSEDDVVSLTGSTTDNTCVVKGLKAGTVGIIAKRSIGSGETKKDYVSDAFTVTVQDRTPLTIQAEKDKVYTTKTVKFSVVDANGNAMEGVRWYLGAGSTATIDQQTGVLTAGTVAEKVTVKPYLNDQYTIAPMEFSVVQNSMNIYKKGATDVLTQIDVNDPIELEVRDIEGDLVAVTSIEEGTDAESALELTKSAEGVYQLKGLKKSAPIEITAKANGFGDVTQPITVNNKSFTVKNGDEVLSSDTVLPIYVGDTITLTAVDGKTAWWYSDKTNKATITLNGGELEGIAATGEDETVLITVDVEGYDRVTFRVKVLNKVPLTGVALKDGTKTPVEVRVGAPVALESILVFEPSNVTHKNIKWTSDDPCLTIENVDGKDMLTANAFGNANITGTYGVAPDEKKITFKARAFAADGIVVDPDMPLELVCGGTLDLKAVLKNAAGETLETPVQWRLKEDANNKVIKNLVDLTGNKLTAYPQSTYDFTVKLEAFIEGNDKVEVAPVEIHVLPRATNIILMKDTEDISDKTIILDVTNAAGIRIDAVIKPIDARQDVNWQVKDPDGICMSMSYGDYIQIKPLSSQKTGTITVVATTADGTDISRETRIEFAKMADSVLITNAPSMMKGGANVQLRTNLDEDKTLTERRVEWSIVNADGDPINSQYASVRVDGFLDTKTVTERTDIYVKATLIANPGKSNIAKIKLCPAVNTIKITRDGRPEEITTKDIVDFAEGPVQLNYTAYPANHIGSEDTDPVGAFVWTSSNEKIATVDQDGLVTLHDAGIVQISCTAYDTDYETALKIARGKIRDDSKVMAIGYKTLEIVKAAGYVVIDGLEFEEIDGIRYGSLIGGKNAVMTATVTTEKDGPLAGNQKVIWSVEDEYGNPTKAATINSRGRLYAKTVKYGTEVVVYATSVEDKEVIGQFHVMIQPKVERTFAAFLEGEEEPINGTLYMNPKEDADIVGKWYTRIESDFSEAVDCTFNSSNPAVAKIGKYDGTLETLKKGSTTITVRATDPITNNVYTTKFTVKVIYTVNHVSITQPKSTSIRSGKSLDLKANVWADEAGTVKADNQAVTWEIFEMDEEGLYVETKAASISSGGRVTARAVTEDKTVFAVVTSKENGYSDVIELTIRPKYAYTITLYKDTDDDGNPVIPTKALPLEMGEVGNKVSDLRVNVYVARDGEDGFSDDFEGAELLGKYDHCGWKTSNKKVAGVNIDGDLVYVGNGTAKVNAYIKVGKTTYTSNTVTISLVKPVTEMTVEKKHSGQELYSGKSLLMKATVNQDATNKAVKWSFENIDDYKFASINERTGLIRAKKGLTEQKEITVKATSLDAEEPFAVTETADVTIYPLMSKITIVDDDKAITKLEMTKEDEKVLTVDLVPVEANEKAIKWTSSRSSIVKIDPKTGKIEALKRGTATIKAAATDGSGKYKTVKVTVK